MVRIKVARNEVVDSKQLIVKYEAEIAALRAQLESQRAEQANAGAEGAAVANGVAATPSASSVERQDSAASPLHAGMSVGTYTSPPGGRAGSARELEVMRAQLESSREAAAKELADRELLEVRG